MQIDIILEPDLTPAQVAEIAVAAENHGFRTLWHSNYHQNPDAFVALVPAALATRKIKLGVLAVSPYEMHPLKIANALLTLNEISGGRAIAAIGGGGSVMGAIGIKMDPKAQRMLRGVREAVEMVKAVTSGKFVQGYPGELFKLTRPLKSGWAKSPRAGVFTCSTGPKMLEMAGRVADGTQMSDVTPEKIGHHMEHLRAGLAARTTPAEDFRIGNFWAWHIKKDRAASMHEARVGLFARAEVIPPHIGLDHLLGTEEAELVRANYRNFLLAGVTGSGNIKGVPPELVQRLIDAVSSSGDFSAIDREVERYRAMERAGLTDLALRVFNDPFDALQVIRERVIPHFS